MTMQQATFLTPQQLVARWSRAVTTGTLANWRSQRVGPSFTKLRGRVLYPLVSVEEWERKNLKAANDDAACEAAG